MRRQTLAAGLVSLLIATALAAEPPRDAETILKEHRAIKLPVQDSAKVADPSYMPTFMEARRKTLGQQHALALELYRAHPGHERALELMLARWGTTPRDETDNAVAEMEQFLKDHPDSPHTKEVLYTRARRGVFHPLLASTKGRDFTEEFIQAYPKDGRGVSLLNYLAMFSKDKELQLTIYRRIAADYAGSKAAKVAAGNIRRIDGLGQPLELAFTEAMGGQPVSIKGLHGKVVVIDFWSTTCGPCIADMPRLKALYAKYKDQGVEFIGVSLDEPGEGLTQMKGLIRLKRARG